MSRKKDKKACNKPLKENIFEDINDKSLEKLHFSNIFKLKIKENK